MSTQINSKSRFIFFSWIGVAFGILALATAIYQQDLAQLISDKTEAAPTAPAPKSKTELSLFGVSLSFTEKETVPPEKIPSPYQCSYIRRITYGLGFIAISCGILAWISQAGHRISAASLVLGILAIAWQSVVTAVAGVLAVIVLILVLSSLAA
ncbi:hypothetical protein P3T73_16915 [Kiritimatiellota bacterium B12222]|nr:hypothetical protein P3T73_16915 [Kiritimatiellota bacterium B12222]